MRTPLILITLLLASGAFAAEDRTNFRLFTSEAALQGVMPAPADRKSRIDEHLRAKVLSGMAYTTGTSRLDLLPSDSDARIRLVLEFTTVSRTTTETSPRPDIKVSVFSSAITRTTVTKLIILKSDHLETLPCEATSRTAITIHGVSARATGSFSGEKRRQAELQAMAMVRASIPTKEAETSERVQGEIAARVDEKARPMIESLNRDYKDIFFVPVFVDKRVLGNLRYYSTEEGLRLAIDKPEDEAWEPVSPLPRLSEHAVFGVNVHQSLLNAKIAHQVAGKVYDEAELEAVLRRQGLKLETHAWGPLSEHVFIRFCDEAPLHVTFEADAARVGLCAKAVKMDGVWHGGARLTMTYTLTRPAPARILLRRSEIAAERAEASDTFSLDRFRGRYGQLFPTEIAMGDLPFPSMGEAMKEVVLSDASIADGWFNLEWKSKESK